jgi:hypothetical protein
MSQIVTSADQWAAKCLKEPEWLAACLQRICRFGGQVPISVLTHSVVLSGMLRTPETQLWALLHDAHEVLTGDCCRLYESEQMQMHKCQLDFALRDKLQSEYHVTISEYDQKEVNVIDRMLGEREFQNPGEFTSTNTSIYQFTRLFYPLMTTLRKDVPC